MNDLLKSYAESKARIDRRIEELKAQLKSCDGNISVQGVRYRIRMLQMESDEIIKTMANLRAHK